MRKVPLDSIIYVLCYEPKYGGKVIGCFSTLDRAVKFALTEYKVDEKCEFVWEIETFIMNP